jgi:hypothetical protein
VRDRDWTSRKRSQSAAPGLDISSPSNLDQAIATEACEAHPILSPKTLDWKATVEATDLAQVDLSARFLQASGPA